MIGIIKGMKAYIIDLLTVFNRLIVTERPIVKIYIRYTINR